MVAEKIIEIVEKTPNLHYFISFDADQIREQAKASTERYASKTPLSLLDGVPFSVKDLLHATGHITTCGTAHMKQEVDALHPEAPIVTSLKNLGGVLLGKTNMFEIGVGNTGLNLHHGTPANPWNADAFPGGSTSGGAASVASGSDGGGSIRIPASFCGVYGLKLTHERQIPQLGMPLGYSVSTSGPLTRCIEDAMLVYALIAQKPSSKDTSIPPVYLPTLKGSARPLEGLKFGVYNEWFDDSDAEVKDGCREALALIERLGGQVVSVKIPELELLRVAHAITIMSEARHFANPYCQNGQTWKATGPDIQINLMAGYYTKAHEYIQAQVR